MKISRRTNELILDVAQHFQNRCMVMNEQWQDEKDVCIGEMDAASDMIALILRGYAALPLREQAKVLAAAASHPAYA